LEDCLIGLLVDVREANWQLTLRFGHHVRHQLIRKRASEQYVYLLPSADILDDFYCSFSPDFIPSLFEVETAQLYSDEDVADEFKNDPRNPNAKAPKPADKH
jgi:ATP synthase j chain